MYFLIFSDRILLGDSFDPNYFVYCYYHELLATIRRWLQETL